MRRAERAHRRRVFFALWPNADFCQRLGERAREVLESLDGRRVAALDWHVTLCFIGSVDEAALSALQAGAGAIAATVAGLPFRLRFDRLQYWPRARLIAAAASEVPAEALELAAGLRQLALSVGQTPDDKPLRPHMTLARGVSPLAWRASQDERAPAPNLELALVADVLHLAESRTPGRAAPAAERAYASLASWTLSE